MRSMSSDRPILAIHASIWEPISDEGILANADESLSNASANGPICVDEEDLSVFVERTFSAGLWLERPEVSPKGTLAALQTGVNADRDVRGLVR